jgi:hypothetical protein
VFGPDWLRDASGELVRFDTEVEALEFIRIENQDEI